MSGINRHVWGTAVFNCMLCDLNNVAASIILGVHDTNTGTVLVFNTRYNLLTVIPAVIKLIISVGAQLTCRQRIFLFSAR